MNDRKKSWALVTGASGGLGAQFARLLSLEGWRLALAGRDLRRLEATRSSLANPDAAAVIAADLSLPGAAESLARECGARGVEVELLVNNAGFGLFGESVDLPAPSVEAMIALNVTALTCLCAAFGRGMRARGRGMILNVGSFAGNQATPYFASYAASKSYVLSYSLALRSELARSGVRVCCLLPGYISTAFDENAGIGSEAYKAFSRSNSLGPEAVARIGLSCLRRNRPYVVAGARNKLAAAGFGLLPRSLPPRAMKLFLDKMIAKENRA